MFEQDSQRKSHASADQNTFEGFAHLPVPRRFPKLIEQGVLVCCRSRLIPFPLAHGDGVNTSELSELNLIETKLPAHFTNLCRHHALSF
jgi:hypothetical protein